MDLPFLVHGGIAHYILILRNTLVHYVSERAPLPVAFGFCALKIMGRDQGFDLLDKNRSLALAAGLLDGNKTFYSEGNSGKKEPDKDGNYKTAFINYVKHVDGMLFVSVY